MAMTADEYNDEGARYFNERIFPKAMSCYDKAISKYPKDPRAYYNKAGLFYTNGKFSHAIKYYHIAIDNGLNHDIIYYNLGKSYYLSGKNDEALFWFDKAIEAFRRLNKPHHEIIHDEAVYHSAKGLTYLTKGNDDQALTCFIEASQLNTNPDKTAYYYNEMAKIYDRKGNDESLKRAIELRDKAEGIREYFLEAMSFIEIGAYNESIPYYTSAIELSPESPILYYYKSLAYYNAEDYNEAIKSFTVTVDLINKFLNIHHTIRGDAYSYLGMAHCKRGREKEDYVLAIEAYNQAEKSSYLTKKSEILYGRAHATYMLDKDPETLKTALNDCKESIKLNPNDPEAYYYMSLIQAELKAPLGAFYSIKKAVGLKPRNKDYLDLEAKFNLLVQEELKHLEPTIWPSDYIHAVISEHIYETSLKQGQPVEWTRLDGTQLSLKDWYIYEVFEDTESGYYGAIYVNSEIGHMILGHRGTDSDIGDMLYTKKDFEANLLSIINNRYSKQIGEAEKAVNRIYELAKLHGYKFSIAGHSLGAWLTAYTALYAYQVLEYHNIHGVLFDSPGLKGMIKLLNRDPQISLEDLKSLDLRIYQGMPNMVNTLGFRLEYIQMYRLDPKFEPFPIISQIKFKPIKNIVDLALHVWRAHKISGLVDTFNINTGVSDKMRRIRKWAEIDPNKSTGNAAFIHYMELSLISALLAYHWDYRVSPGRLKFFETMFFVTSPILLDFLMPGLELGRLLGLKFFGFIYRALTGDIYLGELQQSCNEVENKLGEEIARIKSAKNSYEDEPYASNIILMTPEIKNLLNIHKKVTLASDAGDKRFLLKEGENGAYKSSDTDLTLNEKIIPNFKEFIEKFKEAVIEYTNDPDTSIDNTQAIQNDLQKAEEELDKSFGFDTAFKNWTRDLVPASSPTGTVQTSPASRITPWFLTVMTSITGLFTNFLEDRYETPQDIPVQEATSSASPTYSGDRDSNIMLIAVLYQMGRNIWQNWQEDTKTANHPALVNLGKKEKYQNRLNNLLSHPEIKKRCHQDQHFKWQLEDLEEDLKKVKTEVDLAEWKEDYCRVRKILRSADSTYSKASSSFSFFQPAMTTPFEVAYNRSMIDVPLKRLNIA